MSSSIIDALSLRLPSTESAPSPVADHEHHDLLIALSVVDDPRDRRGRRHPLVAMLAAAVCAVLAGATSFAAIGDWVGCLPPAQAARLGFTGPVPTTTTLWRLLIRIDDNILSAALARWLRARSAPIQIDGRRWRLVIAVDGKVVRGAKLDNGRQVQLLSAYDTTRGIVLAQIRIETKSNEIPAFAPLLDRVVAQLGSLDRVLVVADALHAQTGHADRITALGGHLMVPIKGNQKHAFSQLKALPWTEVPIGCQQRETGHGRNETRTVKALTVATPGGLVFPHAQQAVRITRTRTVKGKTSRETAYLVTSLPDFDAQPIDLGAWNRLEWHIENRVHHVRDTTLREDAHRARTRNGPAVFATLRNTCIGYHHINGETNIAHATRTASYNATQLIDSVTKSDIFTQ